MTASAGGVYRTVNAGLTFTRSSGLPTNNFQVGDHFYWNADLETDGADPNVRYVFLRGTGQGIYKSTDRGASWSFLPTQPRRNYGRLTADKVRAGHLWAGFQNNEMGVGLDFSANGGASWTAIPGFDRVEELDAVDGRIAVLGRRTGDSFNRIYYSGDNGATWGKITRPGYRFGNAQGVAVDPWRLGTVWINTNGRSTARFTPWTPLEIWRNQYFGSPDDAGMGADSFDADGDGQDNLTEFALGIHPLHPSSFRHPSAEEVGNPASLLLRVTRQEIFSEVTVGFESSVDLATWSPLPTLTATASEVTARDDSYSTSVRRFYRVKVTRP